MEFDEKELLDDDMNDDGVTEEDLRRALKEVKSKKSLIK